MNHNSHSNDEEQLVAYLDGELDANSADAVEQRLARDESFRALLARLQNAWDLLDELPQPTVDESFTQTTVEMVAVKMSEGAASETVAMHREARVRNLGWIVAVAACSVVGFFGVRQWQTGPDRALLHDLPVIEKIDEYSEVEDLEFLLALYEEGLFVDDGLGDESTDSETSQ